MKSTGYEIRVVSHEEFDSLPYKRAKASLGLADAKNNIAYVRHTGVKGLDEGTISHEFDELMMKVSPHEEDGIRYKAWWAWLAKGAVAAIKAAIIGGVVGGIKEKASGGKFWGRGMGQGAKWGAAGGAAGGALSNLGGGTASLGSGTGASANAAGASANAAGAGAGGAGGPLSGVLGNQSLGSLLSEGASNFAPSIANYGGGANLAGSFGGGGANLAGGFGGGTGGGFLSGLGSNIAMNMSGPALSSMSLSSLPSVGTSATTAGTFGLGGTSANLNLGVGSQAQGKTLLDEFKPAFKDTSKQLAKEYASGNLTPRGRSPIGGLDLSGQAGSALAAFGPRTGFDPSQWDPDSITRDYQIGKSNIARNSLRRTGSTLDLFRQTGGGDILGNSALQRQLNNIRSSRGASEEALKYDLTQRSQLQNQYKQLASMNGWDDKTMQNYVGLSLQPLSVIRQTFSNAEDFRDAFSPLAALYEKTNA